MNEALRMLLLLSLGQSASQFMTRFKRVSALFFSNCLNVSSQEFNHREKKKAGLSAILDDLKIFKFRFLHYLAESVLVKFLRQEFDSNFLFCMSSAIFSNLASFKCAQ